MVYTAKYGLDKQVKQKIIKNTGVMLPILAVLFIAIALFSFSYRGAEGQNPIIGSPPNNVSSPGSSISPAKATGNGQSAASNVKYMQPVANIPNYPFLNMPPVVGGLGGGTSGNSTPITTTGGGTPVVTTGQGDSNNPAQTTVTIPPINIQAGAKQILSTGGLTLTIN